MTMIPFDDGQWDIQAEESRVEEYLGQQSLFLKIGSALLDDPEFLDGIIEYDIAFDGSRGFAGVLWHVEDEENYEEFYMRPHQSGNPDALQYTPVYKNIAGWQLYSGPGVTGQATFPFDEWIHVKLVVSGSEAEVYIGDHEEPRLHIHNLIRGVESGGIGLKAGPFTAAHFANFIVTPLDDSPQLKSTSREVVDAPLGTIPEWNVSETFAETLLDAQLVLTDEIKEELTWEITVAEDSGLVNLAKVQRWGRKRNTVFVQCRILSETTQTKEVHFGFSDKVKVYLNDQLFFAGNDAAFSRDYRFLGTIGYYDTLYLPLQAGANELWFAVSEVGPLGGWGLQARITDMSGITFGS